MRLIKLKIKNLASLRGEHIIDFEEIQKNSSLFAITGETGSGKSTILNSLGLVLYGKVYKTNINQNDLVTLGEKEGGIELIFQASGKYYFATWRVKTRKQNGEPYSTPQVPTRELYQIEKAQFNADKTILNEKAENILQLDFDQFCKCIILNQGEFARFLTASFSERKEILEKLYPGELIDSLSSLLKKEKDDLEKEIREIDIELHTLKGQDNSDFDLKPKIERLKEESQLYDNWLSSIEKMCYDYSSIVSYQQKHQENNSKLAIIKQNLSKETSYLNQLAQEQTEIKEDLENYKVIYNEKRPKLQFLLKEEERLKILKTDAAKLEIEIRKTKFEYDSTQKQKEINLIELNQIIQEKERLRISLSQPFDSLKNIDLVEVFNQWTKHQLLKNEIIAKKDSINKNHDNQHLQRDKINELEKQSLAFIPLKNEIERLKKEEIVIQDQIRQNEYKNAKIKELTEKINLLGSTIEALKAELESKTTKKNLDEKKLKDIQNGLSLAKLLSAVEECLTHPDTINNESCPVCHSPLTKSEIHQLKEGLDLKDKNILVTTEKDLAFSLACSLTEINETEKRLKEATYSLSESNELLTSLNQSLLTNIPDIQITLKKIDEAQKKYWEAEKATLDLGFFRKDYENLLKTYIELEESLVQTNQKHANSVKTIEEIQKSLNLKTPISDETIDKLRQDEKTLKKINDLVFHEDKSKHIENYHNDHLSKLSQTLSNQLESQKIIEKTIKEIDQILESQLGEKSASILLDEMTSHLNKRADLLASKEKELKNQELKIKELQSRFFSIEEILKDIDLLFSKTILSLKDIAKSNVKTPTNELVLIIESLSRFDLKLTDPQELFIPLQDLLANQQNILKQKCTELKMNIASLSTRLEAWERKQDRIKILEMRSNDFIRLHQKKARLYEILGKDELRTFVLSIVEENLIIQTNDELQKLCQGRYEIIHFSKSQKMTPEFFIMDKFRDGGIRKVSTLSGGETFMVSLAMAIGLAEMTRGKAEIDSLFIDEGFGTLDSESLQDVLDVLKQIQTRGLMIGIISHIKELTTAIPVNLNVLKGQDGNSNLKIHYN